MPPLRDGTGVARAFGVVFGPSVVLDAAAAATVASMLRSFRRLRRPSRAIVITADLVAAYFALGRPLMLHWGANCEELRSRSPATSWSPGPPSSPPAP